MCQESPLADETAKAPLPEPAERQAGECPADNKTVARKKRGRPAKFVQCVRVTPGPVTVAVLREEAMLTGMPVDAIASTLLEHAESFSPEVLSYGDRSAMPFTNEPESAVAVWQVFITRRLFRELCDWSRFSRLTPHEAATVILERKARRLATKVYGRSPRVLVAEAPGARVMIPEPTDANGDDLSCLKSALAAMRLQRRSDYSAAIVFPHRKEPQPQEQ